MKRMIFVVLFLVTVFYSSAQKKIKFSTQNYVGFLAGSSDNDLQLQTINGISFNKWFTGIGTGIDWYYRRSVPVFISVERGFRVDQKKNIYFSTAAGANFPWKNPEYDNDWNWYSTSKTEPGLYLNAGVGYKINIGKQDDAVLLQLGFSNKFFKEKVSSAYPCFVAPCPATTESYNYNLRAVSVKLGYGF